MEILDEALKASEAEHKTKLTEQLKEQQSQQAKVTAEYDKRVAKLNSVIDEKKVIIWRMETSVTTILSDSNAAVGRAEAEAAKAKADAEAAEKEAAVATARVDDLERDAGDVSLAGLIRKACPDNQAVQSIPSLNQMGDRGTVSGRRLSDLGNAVGSVISTVINSTPAGRKEPAKVLEAIASRRDGANTTAGAALREFAYHQSQNSGSNGKTSAHAHTYTCTRTRTCARARTHTHVHARARARTHTRTRTRTQR